MVYRIVKYYLCFPARKTWQYWAESWLKSLQREQQHFPSGMSDSSVEFQISVTGFLWAGFFPGTNVPKQSPATLIYRKSHSVLSQKEFEAITRVTALWIKVKRMVYHWLGYEIDDNPRDVIHQSSEYLQAHLFTFQWRIIM